MDYNPRLKPWSKPAPNKVAGKGVIENPDTVENIVWQTRHAPPSDYENQLGDALVAAFDQGVEDLEPLVAKLNEFGTLAPDGQPWTVATFEAEMARLGY
ncbi:MAG: hypothetical protein K8F25_07580 [Fimbriimonadaceae bacterium]|nr:hypothetical protein [Alphaproteobacteria bacterium]